MGNQLLRQIAVGCGTALNDVYDCVANGTIHLFSMDGDSDHPCLRPANPFLSKDTSVTPIASICAQIETSVGASRDERREAARETQRRTVTFPTQYAVDVKTGWWAYIEMFESPDPAVRTDLIGGRITKVHRDQIVFVTLVVDTSKPVPFRPELAGLQSWPRGAQV